eukprot:352822_1
MSHIFALSFALLGLSLAYANTKSQELYGTNLASIHSQNDFDSASDVCGTAGVCWIDASEWDFEYWGVVHLLVKYRVDLRHMVCMMHPQTVEKLHF